ncbi:MAG TPA: flagellar basal-body rod protein FlgG [Bryobacteraceae bacterium]|jgi:flagellar basal-body rod protein FlgG|nr:flagellar basal-body rod protein FlgG [Bryobacteraceae bacterium]
MIRALFSAASGMNAQQTNVENIANNIANANTAGFKSRRAQFQDLLYQNLIQPGAAATQQTVVPTGLQLGLGTRAVSNEVIFTQGDFSETDNPLDLVIQGNGFFQVLQASGQVAYTKAGTFHLNNTGQIVDPNGNLLDPPITIPPNALSLTIGSDGTVSYTLPGQSAAQQAGQIQLANFVNPSGLNSIGQSLFQQTDASGAPVIGAPGGQDGVGTLMQGYIEQSNVSIVQEFVNLIVSQRAYEANSKVVKAADDMYQQVNNLKQ